MAAILQSEKLQFESSQHDSWFALHYPSSFYLHLEKNFLACDFWHYQTAKFVTKFCGPSEISATEFLTFVTILTVVTKFFRRSWPLWCLKKSRCFCDLTGKVTNVAIFATIVICAKIVMVVTKNFATFVTKFCGVIEIMTVLTKFYNVCDQLRRMWP